MGFMKTLSVLFVGIIFSGWPAISRATLGEPIKSSAKNLSQQKMASAKVTSDTLFTTHEYEERGNTVKEFADKEGVVFAVSWQGVSKPNLNNLFGTYFNEYKEGLDEVPKQYGVKTVNFKTSKMVVRRSGRMRDMRGFVYIPALVPAGVRIEDLQ